MATNLTANDPVFDPEPKESTNSILETSRPGVTRYKRPVVLGIIAALVAIFVIGLIIAFALGGRNTAAVKKDDDGAIQPANPDLTKLPKNYGDTARPDLSGPGTAALPPAGTDPNATAKPLDQTGRPVGQQRYRSTPQLTPAQQRAAAARDLAIRQEMAARSGSIMFDQQRGGGGSGSSDNTYGGAPAAPSDQASQQTAQGGSSSDEPGRQNLQSRKEQFIQSARIDQDYLRAGLQAPVSRYEVKAGTIIPAALVTALNSDLPGEVIATVTENVYDHVTGRYVLIPQGTRLFGKYDSHVAYAQRRALVVWNRIIYPNGTSINIGGMIGSDATGAAGLSDRVNGHFGSLLKGVFLSTAIAVGGAAADRSGTQNNQLVTAGGGAVSQEASRTGQRFVERELDRQPTISIRPGYRLRVIVDKDMVLVPY